MKGLLHFFTRQLGCALPALAMLVPATTEAYIRATEAFNNSPVCSASDLSNDSDEARGNPEWKAVAGLNIDPVKHVLRDLPTVLEGFVPFPPAVRMICACFWRSMAATVSTARNHSTPKLAELEAAEGSASAVDDAEGLIALLRSGRWQKDYNGSMTAAKPDE